MEKSPYMSNERKPGRHVAKIQRKISTIEEELRQLKAMLPNEWDRQNEKHDELRRENDELRAKVARYKRRLAKKDAKEQVKNVEDRGPTPTTDASLGSRKTKAIDDASNAFVRVKKEEDNDVEPTLGDTRKSKKAKVAADVSNLDLLASVASLREATAKLEKTSSFMHRHDESASDGRSSGASDEVVEHDEDERCASRYCRRPGNHELLKWIQCDRWYHCVCVWGKNDARPVPEYSCDRCQRKARSADLHEFLTYDD